MSTTTAWDLFKAGYKALVSVMPPGVKADPDPKTGLPPEFGKVPGEYDGNVGKWHKTHGWASFQPLPAHIEKWTRDGSNIGLQAREFPALDIDVDHPELAQEIDRMAAAHFGPGPVRLSREPRRLRVFGTARPFARMRLYFEDPKNPPPPGEKRKPQLLELLGDGQQYLVAGRHPAGLNYAWQGEPLHTFDPMDLPLVSPEQVDAFFADVAAVAEDFFGLKTRREGQGLMVGEEHQVDQAALKAPSLAVLEEAVKLIPNTNEHFPGRDDFIKMGYAIRAAGGEEALPVFLEWALRWEGNGTHPGNEPDQVEAEWHKMQGPYRTGWGWLQSTAQRLGGYDGATNDFSSLVPLPPGGIPGIGSTPPASAPAAPSAPGAAGKWTDDDLGARLVKRFGHRLRYCEKLGGWMVYSDGVWKVDEKLVHEQLAKIICRDTVDEVIMSSLAGPAKSKIVQRLGSSAQFKALLACARSELTLSQDQFDTNPLLLNTPEGVVDLGTGQMRQHDAKEYHSRQAAVVPAPGKPVKWLRFLNEALGGDQELLRFMQVRAGYWLTGLVDAQDLTFLWGGGGNGKGVFANTLQHVMGTYAMGTPPTTFAATRNEAHMEGIARLAGARLVVSPEIPTDMSWDESKLKQATGGDVMTARFMHKGSFDFRPQFKLLFLGNVKPRIRNMGPAMKRRIKLVPMNLTPATVNPHLSEELIAEEAGQILQWAIEGYQRLVTHGHPLPAAVKEATQDYLEEEDIVGRFLSECCDTTQRQAHTATVDLWEQWRIWTRVNGEHERTLTWLGGQLRQREELEQVKAIPLTKQRGFRGLVLLNPRDEFHPAPVTA